MARRRLVEAKVDPHDAAIKEYRHRLVDTPAQLPEREWEPVTLGPTWQIGEDGHWLLPEHTIGWDVLGWCSTWLQHEGKPWKFTDEQARFVLWWYAVDEQGTWLYTDAVLQRLKGWGKDPLGCALGLVEAVGPCRFAGWDEHGQPLATDQPQAWVQIAAVSLEQTKNTTRLWPGMVSQAAISRFGMQVGKELIHALGDDRLVQAVTAAPATLEGGRVTFVLLNETHHWTSSNAGHAMADVIERNAAKSAGGAARTLRITNAYEPGEDSVAERDRDAYELVQAGQAEDAGLLYDTLEAPPDAPLTAEAAPAVVKAICGDSVWLSLARIVKSILDVRNPPSRSRRFWYNQIVATEDAWVTPQEYGACADPKRVVELGAQITLGFDGSKTDDHSALIASLIEVDYTFEIEIWTPDKVTGEIDRAAIDLAVREAFDRYDVVGFYSDLHPWESYVDAWAEEFGSQLCAKAAASQPIAWDMRARGAKTTKAMESLHGAIIEGTWTHCGSPAMSKHFVNARRAPNRWGVSVRKEHRESTRKIDAVPAAVLARQARMDYLALPKSRQRKKKTGRAAFY